ncbi:hypothetical protein [Streptomyces sp. NPDC101149]|uniref:hypothetical protein n=1 Tax=Streptomyces sp. NPDC101149 TaxID=3366113 RepID=UPI0038200481
MPDQPTQPVTMRGLPSQLVGMLCRISERFTVNWVSVHTRLQASALGRVVEGELAAADVCRCSSHDVDGASHPAGLVVGEGDFVELQFAGAVDEDASPVPGCVAAADRDVVEPEVTGGGDVEDAEGPSG